MTEPQSAPCANADAKDANAKGANAKGAEAKDAASPRRDRWIAAAIFGVAFAVYLTAFSLEGVSFPPHWVYGTDTTERGLRIIEQPRRWGAVYHLKRRPLFVAVSAPVFEVGRRIFGGVDEPAASNLALAFGSALAGALAVVIAWKILRRVCGAGGLASPVLLLYATSGSMWVFAGYPETYAMAALALNLFLLGLLRWPPDGLRAPAIANALAALASPLHLLLAVVPGLRYLRQGGPGIGRIARYAGVIALLYFVPVLLLGGVTPAGYVPAKMRFLQKELAETAGSEQNHRLRTDPAAWAAVTLHHALYATVTPIPKLPPESNVKIDTHYTAGAIVRSGIAYALVAWPFLALVVIGMGWALRRPPPGLPFCRELIAFLGAYLALVGWVNPSEPFLYTAPIVLPVLLVPTAVFAPWQRRSAVRALAWALAVGGAATNLRLVLFLRTLL